MGILHYEESKIVRALDRLAPDLKTAFAAACAERIFPAYEAFSARTGRGKPQVLAMILDELWRDLIGERMKELMVQSKLDTCMALIPREGDGPWVLEQAGAEDTAEALAYAIRCRRNGESQEAGWAARCVYEALDHFVINTNRIDVNASGAENRILSDPLIQAELQRQWRDLDELLATPEPEIPRAITRLRERAKAERIQLFKSG